MFRRGNGCRRVLQNTTVEANICEAPQTTQFLIRNAGYCTATENGTRREAGFRDYCLPAPFGRSVGTLGEGAGENGNAPLQGRIRKGK